MKDRMIFKLILACSCLLPFFGFAQPYKSPPYVKMVENLRKKAIERLSKKHHLYCIGLGGSMRDNVKEISLSFEIYRSLSKNEARALIVDCVQDFLADINRNEEIQPYLEVNPFVAKNVEIAIFIHTAENGSLYHPNLAVVSAWKGNIKYATNDPENKYQYKSKEFETFEEALKIVQEQAAVKAEGSDLKCKSPSINDITGRDSDLQGP